MSCALELGEFVGLSVTLLSSGVLRSFARLLTKHRPSSVAEWLLMNQITSHSRLEDWSGDWLPTKLVILMM